jgi:small neutral amino acid transporter SnatA (MarC family)
MMVIEQSYHKTKMLTIAIFLISLVTLISVNYYSYFAKIEPLFLKAGTYSYEQSVMGVIISASAISMLVTGIIHRQQRRL